MKITIELPDNAKALFVNYLAENDGDMVLVSKGIGTKDLLAGYKDCREYEVSEE